MESAQTQSSGKEKKGLRRIWRRIRDIIRQKPITTTPQTTVQSTTTPAITTKPAPAPEPSETPQPAPVKTQDPPNKQDIKIEVDDTADEPLKPTELTSLPRETSTTTSGGPSNEADMRFQKAQAIFARYNIQLNETDWDMRPRVPYERVSKNIRMRVRYTCHNCSTTFGHDRVCVSCQHRRCTQCSRYPARKDRTKMSTTTAPPADIAGEGSKNVEASCHECQTGFEIGATECPNCQHQICERCLRQATITVDRPPDITVDQAAGARERAPMS
ncbi:hypothetical protein PV11_03106 [Exophiala sideris]|uniref:Uncharacterized protein n=1 Tax=Exophiala sideris TaxID=1016849 RepID=A0A0D1Z154_9EURO|nr:hypothetical protein PV11_03106 [Exophiala sideris]